MQVRQKRKLCFANSAVKPFHRPSLNEELMAIKLPYIAAQLFHSSTVCLAAPSAVGLICPQQLHSHSRHPLLNLGK